MNFSCQTICKEGREVLSFLLPLWPGWEADDLYYCVTGPWQVYQIRASKRG